MTSQVLKDDLGRIEAHKVKSRRWRLHTKNVVLLTWSDVHLIWRVTSDSVCPSSVADTFEREIVLEFRDVHVELPSSRCKDD